MQVGTINKPIMFKDKEKLVYTATTQGIEDEYLEQYKKRENYQHVQRGTFKEEQVLLLLPFLEGVKRSLRVEVGTILEARVKVDIVAVLEDGIIGFQVKSSEQRAVEYAQYRKIGVIWIADNTSNVVVLKQLSIWLDKPLKKEILDLYLLKRKLHGKVIKLELLKLSELQLKAVQVLSIAKVEQGYIKF